MGTNLNNLKEDAIPKIPLSVDHTMKTSHSLFESIEKPIEETYDKLKTKTVDAYNSSIQVVRHNPVKSLATALGLGMVAGYFLKRRK
jgi:ElaB/YqjD/DUF883 family membrane-anchored ribosome-binding protein